MSNLLQNTLTHLGELNISTSNRDTAAVTFDAMQLLEEQKARIAKLEGELIELMKYALNATTSEAEKVVREQGE